MLTLGLVVAILASACGSDSASPTDAGFADAGLGDARLSDSSGIDGAPPTDAAPSPPTDPRLAEGVTLSGVELYQSLQIPLMEAGAALSPTSPVIAGRDAMLRIYVEPMTGAAPSNLTAELEVGPPGGDTMTFRSTQMVNAASRVEDPATTFNIPLPAASLTPDARYRVRLLSADDAPVPMRVAHDARFPRDGSMSALGAQSDMGGIDLVLVPLRYSYDGSGRLPDTSPEQLALFRSVLGALYPVSQLTLSVHDPVDWSDGPQLFTGNFDFSQLNSFLSDLKTSDGAPSASYYYALVQPDPTFSEYCGGSCTTGQSFVVSDPSRGDQRVGGGMGYSGERWAWTLAHELGHMHGRNHAPCGVRRSDPSYPYAGGTIGVWGYDSRADVYLEPSLTTDVMGYCDDEWISDYTYGALFDRVIGLHRLGVSAPARRAQPAGTTRTLCTSISTPEGPSCECTTEP